MKDLFLSAADTLAEPVSCSATRHALAFSDNGPTGKCLAGQILAYTRTKDVGALPGTSYSTPMFEPGKRGLVYPSAYRAGQCCSSNHGIIVNPRGL